MPTRSKSIAIRKSGVPQLSEQDNSLYAMCVALSKSNAVPLAYISKPDQIFSTVVYGREFGLGPMTSLCNIINVNGKPSMSVHLTLGLCMKHKEYGGYEIKINNDKEAKIVMYRRNALSRKLFAYEGSWTIEEAVQAGLMASGMYKKYPKNMLFARAVGFAAHKAFPDILKGVYTVEEMQPDAYDEEAMDQTAAMLDNANDEVATSPKPAKRTPVKVPPKPVNKVAPNKAK